MRVSVSGFFGRPSGWVGRGFRVFCATINKVRVAQQRPCASRRATKPALVGLLNNAMSVSHIMDVMSCKWPNFTAATAFEIQPRAIFFARSAEVGRRVSGFGFSAGLKRVGGCGFRVLIALSGVGWGGKRRNPDTLWYYLRGVPKERAPGDQHRTNPNAHLTAPWPMELG